MVVIYPGFSLLTPECKMGGLFCPNKLLYKPYIVQAGLLTSRFIRIPRLPFT